MNATKLNGTAISIVLLALVAVVVWQQGRTKRLMADLAALRQQVEQAAALREENERLAGQLHAAFARPQADAGELPRLRGQAARVRELEQENARLKTDRNRLAKAAKPTIAEPQEADEQQTPERRLQRAKGFFGRDIGLALIMAAEANEGNLPTELRGPLFEIVEALSGGKEHDIRARQFELVYSGSLRDAKDVGETVLVREKEPVQLSDGQWARLYVMADGSSRFIAAKAPDAFAAREKELWPGQASP